MESVIGLRSGRGLGSADAKTRQATGALGRSVVRCERAIRDVDGPRSDDYTLTERLSV